MAAIDPYKTLGVSQSATQDDIKAAYRKLAKKYHPDLNPGNKEAEAKFKDANQAFEMIGTPEQRAKYDRGETSEGPFGPQGAGAGQGFEGFGSRRGPYYYETQGGPSDGRYSQFFAGDFGAGSEEDLFASLFGRQRARHAPTKGEDTHYAMEVDFREAVLGGEREIQLPSGKRLRVKIPAGIETGKRLRFAGQGEAGPKGLPSGDAYVEIVVRESPQFRRAGQNIEVEIEIPFPVAAVGGEWRVPTVDGAVMLKVPAHSSTGTKLRVRGKGVKDEKTQSRGDQLVVIKLTTPSELSPGLEKSLKEWVDQHAGAAREGASA